MIAKLWQQIRSRYFFWRRYQRNQVPWDTSITPPEIRNLIEGESLLPGQALDLGCGTGTNVVYLAQRGWQATGIDFIPQPIESARQRARQSKLDHRTTFIVGDVTRLPTLALTPPYDLVLDIGCGHSLSGEMLATYVADVADLMKSGAIWMWYAHMPSKTQQAGITEADVRRVSAAYFVLENVEFGEDGDGTIRSAWYHLRKK